MSDVEILEALRAKREAHQEELKRIQGLVKNIDALLSAYNGSEALGQPILSLGDATDPEKSHKENLRGLNITQAILYAMTTRPKGSLWRGTDVRQFLEANGYGRGTAHFNQKVSARLLERSRSKKRQIVRVGQMGSSRFKLGVQE